MFDDSAFTPDGLYVHPGIHLYALAPTATKAYPVSDRAKMKAIAELVGRTHVLYAMRVGELIKVGTTQNLANRCKALTGSKLLAIKAGSFDAEHQVHQYLEPDLHHGREWYLPTERVLAVVNLWREALGLEELTAATIRA